MKPKYFVYLRYMIALIFAALILSAFFTSFYPLNLLDWQVIPVLQCVLIYPSVAALSVLGAILLVTLIFGRIYCSTLCPLGLLQELTLFLIKPFQNKKKRPAYQSHSAWHYVLAAILFGFMLGGCALAIRLFDPYSVSGNFFTFGYWGLAFVTLVILLVVFKRRFFCTNICPVGALLGLISKFSLFKINIDKKSCVSCGLCAKKCPTDSIDYTNKTVNNTTCIKCFKCLNTCHGNFITYGISPQPQVNFNPSRRKFIVGALALGALAGAYKAGIDFTKTTMQKIKNVIIPAGGKNPQEFASRCLNCNLCVARCPAKIIKKADAEYPVVHLDYSDNFCQYNCNECARVCPSGALAKLSLTEKQNTQIAMAIVDEDKCIECGVCAHICPKQVIEAGFGQKAQIDASGCIGCGACAHNCPVEAIRIAAIARQRQL